MNTTEQRTITFENPPIDEIICNVLFDPIANLRAGHLGLLWQKFSPDFPGIEDQHLINPIPDEYLNNPDTPPLPRVWFVHKDENELIQMQYNRFVHNWRKRRPDDIYPGYPVVIENFEKYLSCLEDFLSEKRLGDITPTQYELTYMDNILEHEGWETITDLEKVFPNFISLKSQNLPSTDIREFSWQMLFGLPNDFGQLQLSIRNARRFIDNRHLLRVEFKAVSNQPYKPMRGWFNLAHEFIFDLFSNLISHEIQERFWGRKSC